MVGDSAFPSLAGIFQKADMDGSPVQHQKLTWPFKTEFYSHGPVRIVAPFCDGRGEIPCLDG